METIQQTTTKQVTQGKILVSSLLTKVELDKLKLEKGYQVIALEDEKGQFSGLFPLDAEVSPNLRATRVNDQIQNHKLATGG